MKKNVLIILKRIRILCIAFAFGFWVGGMLLCAYVYGLKRPILSVYVNKGFGRNSVRFVLANARSNDVGTCHYILFHRTGRDRIATHKQAIFVSRARAKEGDQILLPFIYEYAHDSSWDKEIRELAMSVLVYDAETQGIAVVREIATRTNDPMAEVADNLLKTYPPQKKIGQNKLAD